ncbi:UNVERIFIED_CONTAM: UDP-glycosyltransferase 74E2 [Sesamum angustifolium]|uniref:UDP-glycosyltransferase 74E2 n=1 Tax=Sesamum angustifolium TaxID=2727405 RepID=A0AAW2LIJ6_9LAMI
MFQKLEDEVAKALSGLWQVRMVGPIIRSAYLDEQIKIDAEYGGSLWESRGSICTKWLKGMPPKDKTQLSLGHQGAVGCFLTHRRWNSTLEALSLGVLIVAVPQWSDQSMNAKFIEEVWKVGVRAKKDGGGIVRKEEGCERGDGGGKNKEFRKNALSWRDNAKDAISPAGTSCDLLHPRSSRSVIWLMFKFVQVLFKGTNAANLTC